ncbi:hypothetical protein [Hymenobacter actinosclerus]|uniref:hypothetical protein n=1 Tax=Hymenobacter actinosclerus TaxID=82805 RepID=UPI000B897BFE|nr:hypothetical protein [Hymenobacter actinosclerus]
MTVQEGIVRKVGLEVQQEDDTGRLATHPISIEQAEQQRNKISLPGCPPGIEVEAAIRGRCR